MKCYNFTYELEKQSPKTVYVSQNSTFKVGLQVLKGGEKISFSLVAPDGSNPKADGILDKYTTFTLESLSEQGAQAYYILPTSGSGSTLKTYALQPLTIVTTSSSVAELPMPVIDTSSMWTKDNTEVKTLTGQYSDGTDFSLKVICQK